MATDNTAKVLIRLTKLLKIRITKQSILNELERHPNPHSLYAISELLNNWKVPNAAYQLEYVHLREIPTPFIVHLTEKNGEFAVIEKLNGSYVLLSNEHRNRHKMDIAFFKSIFTGSILYAEPDLQSGEENYDENKRLQQFGKLRLPLFIALSLSVFFLSLLQTGFLQFLTLQLALLIVLKTIGLVTSALLLWHSIDANNPIVEKLCTGKNSDCNAILSSSASKITSNLSWAEIGFFYYSGTWLALLFSGNQPSVLLILGALSLCCLPYTFYSVYYQAKIARQWCVFCLTIQILFWTEAVAFFPYLSGSLSFPSIYSYLNLFIYFSIPVLLWFFLKPLLIGHTKAKVIKEQLKHFKYNEPIFRKMLQAQQKQELLGEEDTIILGNREADNILTMVSNPFCQPCAKAHQILHSWLDNADNFRLQIIFNISDTDEDPRALVARHLHQLKKGNPDSLKEAMHGWYTSKKRNVEEWKDAYPVNQSNECQELEKQKDWCQSAKVDATPTLFLNGYRLPNPWQLEDIKYMI